MKPASDDPLPRPPGTPGTRQPPGAVSLGEPEQGEDIEQGLGPPSLVTKYKILVLKETLGVSSSL